MCTSDMVRQALYIKVIGEGEVQAPKEHTQPWNTVAVKCHSWCGSGFLSRLFYGSLVCLSSWSDGLDKRLSHEFWVLCQESFRQIKVPSALVPFITPRLSPKDVLNLNV